MCDLRKKIKRNCLCCEGVLKRELKMEQITTKEFFENIGDYIKPDKKLFIVGIAGGSCSGKTFWAKKTAEKLNAKFLLMDDYILPDKVASIENWDLPEIWNLDLLKQHLINLQKGEKIKKPVYNFIKHSVENYENFEPVEILILEGNYALHNLISEIIDFKIFIDVPEKIRLQRRIKRDVGERGREEKKIIERWERFVQPTYLKFIEPQKEVADVVVVND